MNILIVLKQEKNETIIENNYDVLLSHAKEWVERGNNVYVFGINLSDKWKSVGFRYVKIPGIIPNSIRAQFWFLGGNHPKIDIVIQSLGIINLKYKKTKTVFFIPEGTKGIKNKFKINKLFKKQYLKFYKKNLFLTSKHSDTNKFSPNNFFFLKKSLPNNIFKKRTRIHKDKNTFTSIQTDKKLKSTKFTKLLNIFANIDRRLEYCQFNILVAKNNLRLAKKLVDKKNLNNKINIWALDSKNTLYRELQHSNFLIDISPSTKSIYTDLIAMHLKTIVVVKSNRITRKYLGFESVAISYKKIDPFQVSSDLISLSKSTNNAEKTIEKAKKFVEKYSINNLAKDSLNFLENI
jgi:hypothetical protein